MQLPEKLQAKLFIRKDRGNFRQLYRLESAVDFCSNDYLGFARSEKINEAAKRLSQELGLNNNGSTGSRLISGQNQLFEKLESKLKQCHRYEAALLFNSGFDANIGLLSSIGLRNDVFLFDNLIHASIRDGMRLSHAKAYSFAHNDLTSLEEKLKKHGSKKIDNCYVVTESVFSMDGDCADLIEMLKLCQQYQAHLIVDEAHALGVFDYGLVEKLGVSDHVFATVVTFGKALGAHGAVVLASQQLRDYLINFAHSFIYTTALAPHSLATISCAYDQLALVETGELSSLITHFKDCCENLKLTEHFISSDSTIQSCIIAGNQRVKSIAGYIKSHGFAIKAIVSPTVAIGQERIRFCLHSFNTRKQIDSVLGLLAEKI